MKQDQNKKKHFEEWAKDKSPLLKMSSSVFADGNGSIFEFLQNIITGVKMGGYDRLPPVDEWLQFYRNHRQIYKGVTNTIRQINNETAKLIDLYEQYQSVFSQLKHITKSELQEIKEELTSAEKKRGESFFREILEIIDNDFGIGKNETTELEEKEKLLALLNQQEMIFFMRVWAPCLFLYGEYSTRLFRKARQGDNDALEKLLRLDQTVIADKKIMELFHQGKIAKKKATYNLFITALGKRPKVTLTRRKYKYELAGLISAISISLGQRINTQDIKRLFDAISKDAGKGSDIDFKDEKQPEALTKAVNRARLKWKTIPKPDKK